MLTDIFGQPVLRTLHGHHGLATSAGTFLGLRLIVAHTFDAFLHFAHTGEVFFQAPTVLRTYLARETGEIVLHAVQNTLGALISAVLEEAIERQRGVNFHGHRRI